MTAVMSACPPHAVKTIPVGIHSYSGYRGVYMHNSVNRLITAASAMLTIYSKKVSIILAVVIAVPLFYSSSFSDEGGVPAVIEKGSGYERRGEWREVGERRVPIGRHVVVLKSRGLRIEYNYSNNGNLHGVQRVFSIADEDGDSKLLGKFPMNNGSGVALVFNECHEISGAVALRDGEIYGPKISVIHRDGAVIIDSTIWHGEGGGIDMDKTSDLQFMLLDERVQGDR